MANVSVKVTTNKAKIGAKIKAGSKAMTIAVTEAVIHYGNIYVRRDTGTLEDSSLIASEPEKGRAIWDTPYAKKVYYTGIPSKDVNPNASLMWADKGVKEHREQIDKIAQNAFEEGFGE